MPLSVPEYHRHGCTTCRIAAIKLRTVGYRLICQIDDNIVVVTVVAVGKREKNPIYGKPARQTKAK